jgi:hypothetical protein
MDFFGHILFSTLGFLFYWLRYQNSYKGKKILKSEYDDSFSNLGKIVFFNFLAFGMIILLLVFISSAIFSLF